MKKVALLGSTGSVGTQALDVMRLHPDRFKVTALAADSNALLLEEQVRAFRPDVALLAHPPSDYHPPEIPGVTWLMEETADKVIGGCDTVLNAIVGAQGLAASLETAKRGLRLCLANKESLVAGGALLMREIGKSGAQLLPVDSEHSAIFQCVEGKAERPVKLILTASGGPFRTWPSVRMKTVTPRQALTHPNWTMGKRITTDSATMVNKALEIVEAGWLFGMKAREIDVLVHPASIVHSMVKYRDGSVIAQMGIPDMRTPILYALSYPDRLETGAPDFDLVAAGPQSFFHTDAQRFPALRLGYDVLRDGGVSGAVFNAADEAAVDAFHAGRCGFLDIAMLCEGALHAATPVSNPTLEDILGADAFARRWVEQRLS